MKRNIKVNEKALIDKMNYNISIDPATGESKTTIGFIDKETGSVMDVVDNDDWKKDYFNGKKVSADTISLAPRDDFGHIVEGYEDFDDNEEDRRESRANADKGIGSVNLMKNAEDIEYKKYMGNKVKLRALKRALADVDVNNNMDTRLRTHNDGKSYEEVNHPQHYNNYDVEVIDMMEKVFGKEETAVFCKLNAFKYRMRAGTKPGQDADKDLKKEQWYLNKKKELGY